MDTFQLSISSQGIEASDLKTDFANRDLFSALLDPLCVFLQEITGQSTHQLEVSVQTNRADEVALIVDRFLFRAYDLNKLSIDSWIELEVGTRVQEQFADQLGTPMARRVMNGVELDGNGAPFAFRIETVMDEFQLPYMPRQGYLIGAWLCFTHLWLEDQLGRGLPEVKGVVERHIGPSLRAALPRIEAGELDVNVLAKELEQRYRMSADLAAAMMQMSDWLNDGGAARLKQLKSLDARRKN